MKIEKNKNLKKLTTFRIGGKAQFFCAVKSERELLEAMDFSKKMKLPFFVLGGGSNILVSDEGFKGLVIKMEIKGIEFNESGKNVEVIVSAGEDWDEFVEKCVRKELYGLENLSLIPGTAGAAPVQNIGAYGSEVKDTIETVRVFDMKEGKFKNLSNRECKFEYRSSIFKNKNRYIIVSVTFILKKNGKVNTGYKDIKDYFAAKKIKNPTLRQVREAVIYIRTNKLPDVKVVGTVGSYFINPILPASRADELKARYPELPVYPAGDNHTKVSLAWIIDHVCGYRGKGQGNVETYKNQALVLVNNGKATAKEIRSFAGSLGKIVKEKTGINIVSEVVWVGE